MSEVKHTCDGTCSGLLQCAACGELVGWCGADDKRPDLCRACTEMPCGHCGKPVGAAAGSFSIRRDGFSIGPHVPLCEDCGDPIESPTCEEIWYRIAQVGPYAEARESGVSLHQLLRDVPRAELIDGC